MISDNENERLEFPDCIVVLFQLYFIFEVSYFDGVVDC